MTGQRLLIVHLLPQVIRRIYQINHRWRVEWVLCREDGRVNPWKNNNRRLLLHNLIRRKGKAEDAERKRQRQALELQRERVLSERTSSPHRRSALELALADIEEKLSELGWTIHM